MRCPLKSEEPRYLAVRRALGFMLEEHGRLLPRFVEYAESRGESTVHVDSAVAWAGTARSDRAMASLPVSPRPGELTA